MKVHVVRHIENRGRSWKWGDNLTLRPLHPRDKIARYLLNRGLCGPQSLTARFAYDEENAVGVIWDDKSGSLQLLLSTAYKTVF